MLGTTSSEFDMCTIIVIWTAIFLQYIYIFIVYIMLLAFTWLIYFQCLKLGKVTYKNARFINFFLNYYIPLWCRYLQVEQRIITWSMHVGPVVIGKRRWMFARKWQIMELGLIWLLTILFYLLIKVEGNMQKHCHTSS